jgi:hypothetical protein
MPEIPSIVGACQRLSYRVSLIKVKPQTAPYLSRDSYGLWTLNSISAIFRNFPNER